MDDITLQIATSNDMMDVYNLSNELSVRANSFDSRPIKFGDHQKWFNQKLVDPNMILLIARKDGIMVGQIRFGLENNQATGGISVDPRFRGQGLGGSLLSKGIKYLREVKPEVKFAIAFIKPENIPSIKIFEKNGFVFEAKTTVKNQDALKYKLILER